MPYSAASPAGMDARLLSFLSEESLPETHLTIRVRFAGRWVTLDVPPRDSLNGRRPPRSQCERDVLGILADGKPRRRREIAAELEAQAKIWAESTLAQTLATLVADGFLDNSRRGGGYRRV